METVETHTRKVRSHTASVAVAPRLKHRNANTGQSNLDELREIMMESEASSETQCSLCWDSALVIGKVRLATEV